MFAIVDAAGLQYWLDLMQHLKRAENISKNKEVSPQEIVLNY